MMPAEIPLKMPLRGPSALGTALCVALALCLTAPSCARADDVPSYDDDAVLVMSLGMAVTTSWIVFAVIDLDAASDHRPLSSGAATVEMLLPGMVSMIMGVSLLDSPRACGFGATALLTGTFFTGHGAYALSHQHAEAAERSAAKPEARRARPPAPKPGHFRVAFNPDPCSPRASLSVTF